MERHTIKREVNSIVKLSSPCSQFYTAQFCAYGIPPILCNGYSKLLDFEYQTFLFLFSLLAYIFELPWYIFKYKPITRIVYLYCLMMQICSSLLIVYILDVDYP